MRTKSQILASYREWLENKGRKHDLLTDDELFEILIEHLYQTTEKENGQVISSAESWEVFIKVVIKYYVGTKDELWNGFVELLYKSIEDNQLSAIIAPRGMGKSTILFILYPIFKTFLFEGTDVLLVSNIPAICKRNLRKFKRFIDDNELLSAKKGKSSVSKFQKWGEKDIEFNKGLIETISMGSTPRGAHVPLIILDDALRDDNKYSESYVRDFVLGQLYPATAGVNGRMVVSGTPVKETDILHEIMNEKADLQGKLITDGRISKLGFCSYRFQAITDYENKKVLLPERYSWNKLMTIKSTIGDLRFSREYQGQVRPDNASIFPEGLVRRCIDNKLEWLQYGQKGKQYVIGVDLASSASKRADFTSAVVIEYDPDKKIKLIREVINEKLTAEDQEERIVDLARKFNNALVYIEKNNMGEFLRQKLQNRNVDVEGFTTNRSSKQNFVRYLRSEMMNKRIFFPILEEQYEIVKEQLMSFGYKERRGVQVMEALSGHDDIVDALLAANMATQLNEIDESTAIFI